MKTNISAAFFPGTRAAYECWLPLGGYVLETTFGLDIYVAWPSTTDSFSLLDNCYQYCTGESICLGDYVDCNLFFPHDQQKIKTTQVTAIIKEETRMSFAYGVQTGGIILEDIPRRTGSLFFGRPNKSEELLFLKHVQDSRANECFCNIDSKYTTTPTFTWHCGKVPGSGVAGFILKSSLFAKITNELQTEKCKHLWNSVCPEILNDDYTIELSIVSNSDGVKQCQTQSGIIHKGRIVANFLNLSSVLDVQYPKNKPVYVVEFENFPFWFIVPVSWFL